MTMPPTALPGTRLKYVRARMPGSELVHLVPAQTLIADERFGDGEKYLRRQPGVGELAPIRTPCGRKSDVWIIDARGERRCHLCDDARY